MIFAPAISDRFPACAGRQCVLSARPDWTHLALLAPSAANESGFGRSLDQPPTAYPMIEAYRPKFLRSAPFQPVDEQWRGRQDQCVRSCPWRAEETHVHETSRQWNWLSQHRRPTSWPFESQPIEQPDGLALTRFSYPDTPSSAPCGRGGFLHGAHIGQRYPGRRRSVQQRTLALRGAEFRRALALCLDIASDRAERQSQADCALAFAVQLQADRPATTNSVGLGCPRQPAHPRASVVLEP